MFLAEASIQLVPDGTMLLHIVVIVVMVAVVNRTLFRTNQSHPRRTRKTDSRRISEAKETRRRAN